MVAHVAQPRLQVLEQTAPSCLAPSARQLSHITQTASHHAARWALPGRTAGQGFRVARRAPVRSEVSAAAAAVKMGSPPRARTYAGRAARRDLRSMRASAMRWRLRPRVARKRRRSRASSGDRVDGSAHRSSNRSTHTSRSRLPPAARVSSRSTPRARRARRPDGLWASTGSATLRRRVVTRMSWTASGSPASALGRWRNTAFTACCQRWRGRSALAMGRVGTASSDQATLARRQSGATPAARHAAPDYNGPGTTDERATPELQRQAQPSRRADGARRKRTLSPRAAEPA